MSQGRDGITLALMAVLLAGCGSSGEPSGAAVTGISLELHTTEWEIDRHLVVVGEDASAEIATVTNEGCSSGAPCPVSADVELQSSDPSVLSPAEQRVRAPATVALVAHAPGTATVTATVGGLTQSRRVDVTTEPLPLDAIQLTLVTEWNDLPVQYDPANSLSSVEIPDAQYAALEGRALRNGAEVFGVQVYASPYASNPPVTEVTVGCRPTRVDILCEVVHDLWVYGMMPGDDQIIVWARTSCNTADPSCTWTSFTAHVVESPSSGSLSPRVH